MHPFSIIAVSLAVYRFPHRADWPKRFSPGQPTRYMVTDVCTASCPPDPTHRGPTPIRTHGDLHSVASDRESTFALSFVYIALIRRPCAFDFLCEGGPVLRGPLRAPAATPASSLLSVVLLYLPFSSWTYLLLRVALRMDRYNPLQCVALGNTTPPYHGLPAPMSPAGSFFESLNHTLHSLGIWSIAGAAGYATDSQLTYRCLVEWVERLCEGDGDATLATILFLSVAFGSPLP